MLHVNVDLYHTTNRTATTNGPISLAGAASLGKCGYGNGIAVMEHISGTVLKSWVNLLLVFEKTQSTLIDIHIRKSISTLKFSRSFINYLSIHV